MSYGNENKLHKDLPVVMNDALIYSRYHTTPTGMKLMFTAASKIKEDDMALKEFIFSVKEFCNLLDIKATGKYNKLKLSCESLIQSYVSVDTKKGWRVYPWFHHIDYLENEGKVVVQFHEYLSSYLLYVRDNIYTKLSLNSVLKFQSQYSMRFYMFCRQVLKEWNNKGEKTFTIEELRLLLGVDEDEYPKYGNFKQKVILKAQKEINELSDVHFDFEEEKEARSVVRIRLIITTNSKNKEYNNISHDGFENKSMAELAEMLVKEVLKRWKKELNISTLQKYKKSTIIELLSSIMSGCYDSTEIKYINSYFKSALDNIEKGYSNQLEV